MAYTSSTLENVYSHMAGSWKMYRYISTDAIATVVAASYITDARAHRLAVGDFVWVINTSTPITYLCHVKSVSTDNATLEVVTTSANGTFVDLTTTGNTALGDAVTDTIGFYGVTKVSQRASSNQASSNIVTSASFGTLQQAHLQEVYNALAGIGIWKGAA